MMEYNRFTLWYNQYVFKIFNKSTKSNDIIFKSLKTENYKKILEKNVLIFKLQFDSLA